MKQGDVYLVGGMRLFYLVERVGVRYSWLRCLATGDKLIRDNVAIAKMYTKVGQNFKYK